MNTKTGLSGELSEGAVVLLRFLCIDALQRMFRPLEGMFARRLRSENGRDVLDGISCRCTAIVLIALAKETRETIQMVLGTHALEEICTRLLANARKSRNLGEAALAVWAARAMGHPETPQAVEKLRAMRPDTSQRTTVEVAWSLSALAAPGGGPTDERLAGRLAERLMQSFVVSSDLFPHLPKGARSSHLHKHVCCYADLAYPIQALSFFHRATGNTEAREIAGRCAARMCELQGTQGQWWWHYDVRTGRVLEQYPVYAVHQDAMGPMALFDLRECCGFDHRDNIVRSMCWLLWPPDTPRSLIDGHLDVIWSKLERREPGKLVRYLQVCLSRIHPRLRVPRVDTLFPPGYIECETRPHEMGWMLYAWNPQRVAALWSKQDAVGQSPSFQRHEDRLRAPASTGYGSSLARVPTAVNAGPCTINAAAAAYAPSAKARNAGLGTRARE